MALFQACRTRYRHHLPIRLHGMPSWFKSSSFRSSATGNEFRQGHATGRQSIFYIFKRRVSGQAQSLCDIAIWQPGPPCSRCRERAGLVNCLRPRRPRHTPLRTTAHRRPSKRFEGTAVLPPDAVTRGQPGRDFPYTRHVSYSWECCKWY